MNDHVINHKQSVGNALSLCFYIMQLTHLKFGKAGAGMSFLSSEN